MLKKLLKYDIASIIKIWLIAAGSTVVASILAALALRFFIVDGIGAESPLLLLLGILVIYGFVFVIAAFSVITTVLVFYRYYKNFFSDEGYLTFTLPVKRSTLFLSKTVNAMIFMTAHTVIVALCLINFIGWIPTDIGDVIFSLFAPALSKFAEVCGGWVIVYAVELIVLPVSASFFSTTLVHFCITVGAVIAKRFKAFAAIGIYYGVSSVLTTAVIILGTVFGPSFFSLLDSYLPSGSPEIPAFLALLLLAIIVFEILMGTVMYIITLDKLERKLNMP